MRRFILFILLIPTCQIFAQEQNLNNDLAQDFWEILNSTERYEEGVSFILDNDAVLQSLILNLAENLTPEDSLFQKLFDFESGIGNLSLEATQRLAISFLQVAETKKDSLAMAQASISLANANIDRGQYDQAQILLLDALSLIDKQTNTEEYVGALNSLANNFIETRDYTQAIQYLDQVIAIAREAGMTRRVITGSLNKGVCLMEMGLTEEAIEMFEDTRVQAAEVGFRQMEAYSYGNIAYIYTRQDEIQKAIEYQSKGLAIEEEINDKLAMIDSHGVLSLSYAQLGNRQLADYHFEQCLAYALELNATDKLLDTYEISSQMYADFGDYEKAYELGGLYNDLRDSIFTVEKNRQLTEMREKYEADQREIEIDTLQKDNDLARSQNLILIISAIAILIAAGFGFVLLRQARKRKKEVEERNILITQINEELSESQDALLESNKLKDRFFALVAHDLRGPITSFQGIGQMLEYMIKRGKQDRVAELIKSVDQSAGSVNMLLDNLLKWSLSQTGTLSFNPEILDLQVIVNDAIAVYEQGAEAKGVTLSNSIGGQTLVEADRNMLSTIFRNLIGNALKFTPEGGNVVITAEPVGDELTIKVKDSGVGIPAEKLETIFELTEDKSTTGTKGEKGTGLGLMLCKEFVEKNGGQISIKSNLGQGTSIQIELPAIIRRQVAAEMSVQIG